MPASRHARLEEFRVGYVLDDAVAPIGSDMGTLYEGVLSELRKAGARLDQGWPAGINPRTHLNTLLYLLGSLVTADMDAVERERARERFAKDPNDMFAAAAVEPHARWLHETQRRLAYRALWQRYFESYDVFLLPPTVTTAFLHDQSEPIGNRVIETPAGKRPYVQDIPYWTGPATLAGLPATVAPIGRTGAGLPAGIQIVGPMWEDGTSIEFAALLSDRLGGYAPPPEKLV